MSVQYVKGSSPLGSIGTIAQLGGMALGVPWVSALGMGMNAADGLINGYQTPGFQNYNSNPLLGLGGLFSSNIAANPDLLSQRGK